MRFADSSGLALFYGLTEGGFDSAPPRAALTQGLEVEREFQVDGKVVAEAKVGQVMEVHVKLRATGKRSIPNVAVINLLPAGFEVIVDHSKAEGAEDGERGEGAEPTPGQADEGDGQEAAPPEGDEGEGGGDGAAAGMVGYISKGGNFAADFADVREDRVLLFGTVEASAREFVYAVRATTQGKLQVPPIFTESMYDHTLRGRSLGATFEVKAPQ